MLELKDVYAGYGGAGVLSGISLEVGEGEVVALLGTNGAGKSTALNVITGVLRPTRGSVTFNEKELSSLAPHQIVETGISLVPEGRRLFPYCTVRENIDLGAYRKRAGAADRLKFVLDLFPILAKRKGQLASTLSGGEQQMVAIARALMAAPKLLLLDEPSLGLAPLVVKEIYRAFEAIRKTGTSILLVEQNARIALQTAERGYVMQSGEVVLSDAAENLRRNALVIQLYLGKSYHSAT